MGVLSPIGNVLTPQSWLVSLLVFFPFSTIFILSLGVPALVLLRKRKAISLISVLMAGLACGEVVAIIFCFITKFDNYWFLCMGLAGLVTAGGVQLIFRFSNENVK
jgi:hypothetical protein